MNHKNKRYPVEKFVLSGSVSEGLKVCQPNEFDVIIPIVLSNVDWLEGISTFPGIKKFRFKQRSVSPDNYWFERFVKEKHFYDNVEIHAETFLSPEKIGKKLKNMLFEAIECREFKALTIRSDIPSIVE